jgi:hypothetical protein
MDLKIQSLLIDALLTWSGSYVQKYPDLSYSLDTWKLKHEGVEANERNIKWKAEYSSWSQVLRSNRRRNPPCNAEDNLHSRHIIIESLVRGLLRESWI